MTINSGKKLWGQNSAQYNMAYFLGGGNDMIMM